MVANTIVTKSDLFDDLRARMNDVSDRLSRLRTATRKEQHDDWVARGGCDRCGGRGWVVVWDTLDSLSGCYAEYGACPAGGACTAKILGADPGYYDTKYDRLQHHTDTYVPSAEETRLAGVLERLKVWEKELLDEARVERGKVVVVVSGRKVPQGTVGEVIWHGRGNFGARVGLKDQHGIVHWTSANNVEVV